MNAKRRKAVIIISLSFVVLVAIIEIFGRETEPRFGTLTLTQWIEPIQTVNSTPEREVEPRRQAIQSMGTNAIVLLAKWTDYERPAWHGGVDNVLRRFPSVRRSRFVHSILDLPEQRATWTAEAFGWLGEDAAIAVPILLRIAENTNRPVAAKRAQECISSIYLGSDKLLHRGEFVISALHSNALIQTNIVLRSAASNALNRIPPWLLPPVSSNQSLSAP